MSTIIVERAKKQRKCHRCGDKIKGGERCLHIATHGYPHGVTLNVCGNCMMDIGELMIMSEDTYVKLEKEAGINGKSTDSTHY